MSLEYVMDIELINGEYYADVLDDNLEKTRRYKVIRFPDYIATQYIYEGKIEKYQGQTIWRKR